MLFTKMKVTTTLILVASAASQLNLGDLSGAFGSGARSSSSSEPVSSSSTPTDSEVVSNSSSLSDTPPAVSSVSSPPNPTSSPPSLEQKDTCPVCFDCSRNGCTNFGSCEANAACSCPDGWGFQDCSKPLCGGLSVYNTSRPVSNFTSPCDCASGWTGPNCNVCADTNACSALATSTLGTSNICNQSPVVWGNKHFSYCSVNEKLIQIAYGRSLNPQVTVERNSIAGTTMATMWLNNKPQFSCYASSCSQTFADSNMTSAEWTCSDTKCICQPGTLMCGGSTIDISKVVNVASGGIDVSCVNSTSCNLKMDFIAPFFPKGIALTACTYGECVDQYATPISKGPVTTPIDSIGVAAISIAVFLIIICELCIVWGFMDKKKKMALQVPCDQPGMTVSFNEIAYRVGKRQILNSVTGAIRPGELLAIMGPSGSGKTTFLDILARKRKGGHVTGEVLINDSACPNDFLFRRISGYVDQEDIHLPMLTVREVLEFSAFTRLPESISYQEKMSRVETVMKQLGLSHVADSRVGDALKRGLSGGEKKRLSIAVELVTNPSILFVDEPTSGLDSFNAYQVIQTLANLATEHKKTVICTVHQPNSSIFNLFDHVLLLARGSTLYFGPAKEAASFCEKSGYPCPPSDHIADHLLNVASLNKTLASPPSFIEARESMRQRSLFSKLNSFSSISEGDSPSDPILQSSGPSVTSFSDPNNELQGASMITQTQQVMKRSFKVFLRNPTLFVSHICLSVGLGFFIGFLYYQVDSSLAGIQNRLGSIFFMQALLAFGGLSAISSLSEDKVLFIRERSNGFYGPFPYFLSKVVFDLIPLRIIPSLILCSISYYLIGFTPGIGPFVRFLVIMVVFAMNSGLHGFVIACMIPETSTSTLAAVMSILFQMLFSGVLVNQVNIPIWVGWIQYLSFFKYAYEACIANEAGGLTIKATIAGVSVEIPATTVLNSFGLDSTAYYKDMAVTLGLDIIFLLMIFLLIAYRLKEMK